jgi:FixJ family two-component response regulator
MADVLQNATVFVAKRSESRRQEVSEVLRQAGLAPRCVESIDAVDSIRDKSHPACIVADVPTVQDSALPLPPELQDPDAEPCTMVASAFVTDDVECAFETGAVTFLRKPYTQEALLTAVARAVARDVRYQEEHAADADILRHVASLSPRERRILDMIYNGFPNKVIAKRLDVSIRTVEGERHDIFEKFDADTAVDLVRILSRAGYEPREA